MVTCASGKVCCTAMAITWADVWRNLSRSMSDSLVGSSISSSSVVDAAGASLVDVEKRRDVDVDELMMDAIIGS